MTITNELLNSICNSGGFNSAQLNILGQVSTPKAGWKESVIGREISEDDLILLIRLKGAKPKEQRRIYPQVVTRNYPKKNKRTNNQ